MSVDCGSSKFSITEPTINNEEYKLLVLSLTKQKQKEYELHGHSSCAVASI